MSTTLLAAVGTAVLGLGACAWLFLRGPRQDRMTACVLAAITVCLTLVFVSMSSGHLGVLDVALLAGFGAPLGTVLVAARGRGLRGGGGSGNGRHAAR